MWRGAGWEAPLLDVKRQRQNKLFWDAALKRGERRTCGRIKKTSDQCNAIPLYIDKFEWFKSGEKCFKSTMSPFKYSRWEENENIWSRKKGLLHAKTERSVRWMWNLDRSKVCRLWLFDKFNVSVQMSDLTITFLLFFISVPQFLPDMSSLIFFCWTLITELLKKTFLHTGSKICPASKPTRELIERLCVILRKAWKWLSETPSLFPPKKHFYCHFSLFMWYFEVHLLREMLRRDQKKKEHQS